MSALLVNNLASANSRLFEYLQLHHDGAAMEMVRSIEKFLCYEHEKVQAYSGEDVIRFLVLAVVTQRHYGSVTQVRRYEQKLLGACRADKRFEYSDALAEANHLTATTQSKFEAELHSFFKWMSHVKTSILARFNRD